MKHRINNAFPAILILCLAAVFVLPVPALSDERIYIEADMLEVNGRTLQYRAEGHVRIERGNARIEADAAEYDDRTSDAEASGNVLYEDTAVRIRAKEIRVNLVTKTGRLSEGEIFVKRDNYHITGLEIEKRSEREYLLKSASFTTCDAPVPAWCFRGRDVSLVVGEKLTARGVTFNIKERAVLYSPYLTAPIGTERKTGFLIPAIGYSSSRGLHYEQPFFVALAENQDATVVLDLYGRRGIGKGVEYRLIEPDNSRGHLWAYHIYDRDLDRNFWDLRGVYENREAGRPVNGFLNINYINERQYYSEYASSMTGRLRGSVDPTLYLNLTTTRFFESTGEISLGSGGDRLSLSGRYLIDLKEGADRSTIIQQLPMLNYFLAPRQAGPFFVSLSASLGNFWRDSGTSGQRLDLYPRILHSFGSDVIVSQSLGLRETAYALRDGGDSGSSPRREGLDYSISAQTRLVKPYGSFTHIVEPSLGFTYIPHLRTDLPLFDATELYGRTSKVELSIRNRFLDSSGEFLSLRVSQAFDPSVDGDRPFIPLTVEAAIQRPVSLRASVAMNVHTGNLETAHTDLTARLSERLTVTVGERYHRTEDILFSLFGLNAILSKEFSAEGYLWYDAKGGGLRDFIAKLKYQKQCWGMSAIVTKSGEEYSFVVLIDLLGIGTIRI